jgi:hypothetical protein
MPSTPASATPNGRYARAGTAESHASSRTLTFPAPSRTQRGVSVASRPTNTSSRTGATQSRKRHFKGNLSSDEEDAVSDYAPSEPDSPSADKKNRKDKEIPASKKGKMADGAAKPKVPVRVEHAQGKNSFGFKPLAKAQPKTSAPSPTAAKKPTPSSSKPAANSAPQELAEKETFSRRKAARKAENKIHGYFEEEEEFVTECAIEDANHVEQAWLPDHMRGLSMTPAPSEGKVASEFVGRPAVDESEDEAEDMPSRFSRTRTTASKSTTATTTFADTWGNTHTEPRRR